MITIAERYQYVGGGAAVAGVPQEGEIVAADYPAYVQRQIADSGAYQVVESHKKSRRKPGGPVQATLVQAVAAGAPAVAQAVQDALAPAQE